MSIGILKIEIIIDVHVHKINSCVISIKVLIILFYNTLTFLNLNIKWIVKQLSKEWVTNIHNLNICKIILYNIWNNIYENCKG